LNIMGLHSAPSAVLASVIFNALIIIVLIPLALRGVKYRPMSAAALLPWNLADRSFAGPAAPRVRENDYETVSHRTESHFGSDPAHRGDVSAAGHRPGQ